MDWNWIKCGQFKMETSTMRVSDPCYNKGFWSSGILEGCITGKWNAYAKNLAHADQKYIGSLAVQHESCHYDIEKLLKVGLQCPKDFEHADFVVNVCSDQAGFFDDKYYGDAASVDLEKLASEFSSAKWGGTNGPSWFHACCNIVLYKYAGTLPYGAVSLAGVKEGEYPCCFHRNADGLVDIAILSFLPADYASPPKI